MKLTHLNPQIRRKKIKFIFPLPSKHHSNSSISYENYIKCDIVYQIDFC